PALAGSAIMMLSSSDLHEDARRCRETGISSYLVKPVNEIELRHAVLRALGATHAPELQTLAPAVSAAGLPQTSGRSRPPRILLAEDNAVNQKLMIRLLEKGGYSVTVAQDGQKLLEAYHRETFDLALMDVQMPGMGGFEATQAIRQAEI